MDGIALVIDGPESLTDPSNTGTTAGRSRCRAERVARSPFALLWSFWRGVAEHASEPGCTWSGAVPVSA
jgi:hypothetical protein